MAPLNSAATVTHSLCFVLCGGFWTATTNHSDSETKYNNTHKEKTKMNEKNNKWERE